MKNKKIISILLLIIFFIAIIKNINGERNYYEDYNALIIGREDCKYCVEEEKIINSIISEGGLKKIKFIDVTNNENLKKKLKVEYVPTIILIKDGKEIKRIVGLQEKKILKDEFNNNGIY